MNPPETVTVVTGANSGIGLDAAHRLARVGGSLERKITEDGFELTLQMNHLAPFLLTHLLLGPLRAGRARVVSEWAVGIA